MTPITTCQALKFSIGDFNLGRVTFEASVFETPLECLIENRLPRPEACPGIVVAVVPASARRPRLSSDAKRLCYVPIQYSRFYVKFQKTFDEYLAQFSRKSRANRVREVKAFAAQSGGRITWRQYRTPDDLAMFFDAASELSRKTYQERMGLLGEGFASLVGSKEQLVKRAEHGAVLGNLLFLHDRAVAYNLCECESKTVSYAMTGYDQAYSEFSPGNVLLHLTIESLHNQDTFKYLDFGQGFAWYKKFYATDSIECARVYWFPRTTKWFAVVTFHAAVDLSATAIARILDRLGLRDRIRRAFRQQSVPS